LGRGANWGEKGKGGVRRQLDRNEKDWHTGQKRNFCTEVYKAEKLRMKKKDFAESKKDSQLPGKRLKT